MGLFDRVTEQSKGEQNKLDLNGAQFHELSGYQAGVRPGAGSKLDFSLIINGGTDAAKTIPHPSTNPQPGHDLVLASSDAPRPKPASGGRPGPVADAGGANPPRPPHPDQADSPGAEVGALAVTGFTLGASIVAGRSLANKVRAGEIDKVIQLDRVTQPETLGALRDQTSEVIKLVASKSREAAAAVDKLALAKPHAFQEMTETLPAKAAFEQPTQLVFKQVKAPRALTQEELALPDEARATIQKSLTLTEEELAVADRAQYLRSMERVLVKDFNIGDTTTVSAFRSRKPYINGLGKSEAASMEGIADPLNKIEALSSTLMEQTTTGRLALHSGANAEILKGMGVLAGSFLASRVVDRALYGGQSQGFLTTAYDCAAPFLVLTKMSPLAKIGLMVGGHELVRGVEYLTAKNKDQ